MELLRHADQHWLARVRLGLRMAGASGTFLVWTAVMYFCLLFLGLLFIPRDTDSGLERFFESMRAGFAAVLAIAALGVFVGMFIAATVEPRLTGGKRLLRAALAINHLLAAASVGLCGFVSLRGTTPALSLAQLLAIHLCLASIALSIVGAAWLALELERRCEATTTDRVHTIRGLLFIAIVGPIVLCGLAWLGPLRWINAGAWSQPTAAVFRPLLFVLLLLWLATTRTVSRSRRAIDSEMISPAPKQ